MNVQLVLYNSSDNTKWRQSDASDTSVQIDCLGEVLANESPFSICSFKYRDALSVCDTKSRKKLRQIKTFQLSLIAFFYCEKTKNN